MMDIRLIAFDLDGTLLNGQKQLSENTVKELKECVCRGIEIIPCTGRVWKAIPDFIRNFPGIHYAITANGAKVEDVKEGRLINERQMSCKKTVELLNWGRQFRLMYDIYTDGRGFIEERFIGHMSEYGVVPWMEEVILGSRKPVPDVVEMMLKLNQPAEKINYFFGDMEERARIRALLSSRDDVVVCSSIPYNLELNEPGATKGEALLRLADYVGLDPSQTMCFGDGENDISMLQMAGVGVAMENGIEAAKEAADYVTASNEEDGVARMLERLLRDEIC